MKDLIQNLVALYVIQFCIFLLLIFLQGINTKKQFWALLIPFGWIIYFPIWIYDYYKTLD